MIEAVWQTDYGAYETRRVILVGTTTNVEEEQTSGPEVFRLEQSFPNPFNTGTTIRFSVPDARGSVQLAVYDLLGREVVVLVDGVRDSGYFSVIWDGKDKAGREAASGIYLYRLEAGGFTETRKALLLR